MKPDSHRPSRKRLIYRQILFLATLIAVIWFMYKNFERISEFEFRFDRPYVVLSLLSIMTAYLTRFTIWLRLASRFGLHAGIRKAARAFFLSILGRYIPGKIGLALIRVEAYDSPSPDRVVLATAVELILALSAALTVAMVGFYLSPISQPTFLRAIPLVGIAMLITLLSPPILKRAVGAVLKLLSREQIHFDFSFTDSITFFLIYIIPGLFHGLGLFLLINSMAPVGPGLYLPIAGIYYAANLVGVITLFAPGGLGVREGILFLTLPLLVGKEVAIISAILIRIITIFAELILAGVSVVVYRKKV